MAAVVVPIRVGRVLVVLLEVRARMTGGPVILDQKEHIVADTVPIIGGRAEMTVP